MGATSYAGARSENAAGVAKCWRVPPSLDVLATLLISAEPPLDSQVERVLQTTISPVGKHTDARATIASTYCNTTYGDARDSAHVVATDNRPAAFVRNGKPRSTWIAGQPAVRF